MKVIIWNRPDGGISVTTPIEPMLKEESESEYFDRIEANLRISYIAPDGRKYPSIPDDWVRAGEVEQAELPPRVWRNASAHGCKVDLGKAREITKTRLRHERAPLLPQADRVLRDAALANDTAGIAAAQKELQRLRDVTKLPDGCGSLDDLLLVKVA